MNEEDLIKVVPNVTEDTYEIFESLWWAYKLETCPNYAHLKIDTGKNKEDIKKLLDVLKKMGFVKTYRGLMTEEGEVAGSGFSLTSLEAFYLVELALYRYNYNDRPLGREEDYVPQVIKVGEHTYKLTHTTKEDS